MRRLPWLCLILMAFSGELLASAMIDCGPGNVRQSLPGGGLECVPELSPDAASACGPGLVRSLTSNGGYLCMPKTVFIPPRDCAHCQLNTGALPPALPDWFQGFPSVIYQPAPLPWWALQGNLFYPNLHYPGAWNYPGMDASHYSGEGQVFAAKPNVYVNSIHPAKDFKLTFTSADPSFLATTPFFNEDRAWKGRVNRDSFEVDGVNYDYLFYDVRLPKDKMQFGHGVCATREFAIGWMLDDLRAMSYPAVALQDFEEHWKVKIPDYPFYCIYPQYNGQLDGALSIELGVDQSSFTRALYVLVPHKTEPDADAPNPIPLPTKETESLRPPTKIIRENMFREWGVAFLDASA